MDSINIILIIFAFINLYLGFFVFTKNKKQKINQSYLLLALSLFSWAVAEAVYRNALTREMAVIWARILYALPLLVANSFLLFCFYFPARNKKISKILFFPVLAFFVVASQVTLLTGLIIENVDMAVNQEKQLIFGQLYFLYPIYLMVFFAWAFIILHIKKQQSAGALKSQLIIIFWGCLFSVCAGMITNLFFVHFELYNYFYTGHFLGVLVAMSIAYAMVRHRLMDIRYVMRSSVVYLFSLGIIIGASIMVKTILNRSVLQIDVFSDFFILLLSMTFFPTLKNHFYKITNKYFFTSLYSPGEVIATMSEQLRKTLDIDKIYDIIYLTLRDALHFKSFGILIYDSKQKSYIARYNKGFKIGIRSSFSGNLFLYKEFTRRNKSIMVEETRKYFYNDDTKELLDLLDKMQVKILTPLNVGHRTIGMLVLGPKQYSDMYNDDDLHVLKFISIQAAIAIENALLYKESLNFNIYLKNEVQQRTKELRRANRKLKQLDQAKSDFISIASHQLRTPLTIVKGYISMLLENNFGKLTKREVDPLRRCYESNERLINLVENLLNISRIESGHVDMAFELAQLEDMVESVVDELQANAKNKNIKLLYEKPRAPLPKVKIDKNKLRQTVMNLIDNAIKYTNEGQVSVRVTKLDKEVQFCVQDTGMGISKEDLPNLFKKFSRGTGTALVHTEGTGLGLFVAKQMVELHKGVIWAESKIKGRNKGTKFIFKLPIAEN